MVKKSKTGLYGDIPKSRFKRWTTSHQRLDMTGHLILLIDFTDIYGQRTRQVGESTQGNMKKRFEIAFDQAYLNAVYRHFAQTGRRIIKTDEANVNNLIAKAKVIKWTIKYYTDWTTDEDKSPFTIKNFNMRGKRYTDTRFRGKLLSRERYKKISKKTITTLIEERTQA